MLDIDCEDVSNVGMLGLKILDQEEILTLETAQWRKKEDIRETLHRQMCP